MAPQRCAASADHLLGLEVEDDDSLGLVGVIAATPPGAADVPHLTERGLAVDVATDEGCEVQPVLLDAIVGVEAVVILRPLKGLMTNQDGERRTGVLIGQANELFAVVDVRHENGVGKPWHAQRFVDDGDPGTVQRLQGIGVQLAARLDVVVTDEHDDVEAD